MKRIRFATMAIAAAGVNGAMSAARAQDPVPHVRPAPVAHPAPLAPVAPLARAARAPRAVRVQSPDGVIDPIDVDMQDEIARARAVIEDNRDAIVAARDMARDMAWDTARDVERDVVRAMAVMPSVPLPPVIAGMPAMPAMPVTPRMPSIAPRAPGGSSFDGFRVPLPASFWARGDPADSAYRTAHDALNRGEYGRAAKLFADLRDKYPKSDYQDDARYYEAYARYKLGSTDELHTAAKLLEPLASKPMSEATTPNAVATLTAVRASADRAFRIGYGRRGARDGEVAALYNRINGVLAQRGDRDAADKIAKAAAQTGTAVCDNEDIQVRVEAMNALSQMDPAAALPLLRRVLERKDECSSELRRRAVFMLGRRADTESAQLLIATAKADPNYSVRSEAMNVLPRLPGEVGLKALEDMLRTEQDERVQRAIVRSLAASDNQVARSGVRALIERNDVSVSLRTDAINAFNGDRASADDAAYLRNYYGKADNERVKEAIIGAVGRLGGSDNEKWVLSIAQNQNESSQLRATAISRLIRSNVPVGELAKLYDGADSYNVRSQIVSVLSNRKEPEATDKLLDIVKNSTVVSLRTQAMNALMRKNDPRSVQLFQDLLDGKKP